MDDYLNILIDEVCRKRDIFKQKISRSQIREMFRMHSNGDSNKVIAEHFGVSRQWVGMVFRFERRANDTMMLMAEEI